VNAHVLAKIVMSTEVLATSGVWAFVRFLIGMDTSNMSLEVLPSSEALVASVDSAHVRAGILGDAILRDHNGCGGYATATTLLREIGNRDGRCEPSSAARKGRGEGRTGR